MSRQAALWMLICIIVAGVCLRSYELTARSLWFDEAFSWRLIQFSFPEMLDRAAADVHPPLYYVVLRGWAFVFGSSLVALRSFSVTMAALTIAAMYGFVSYTASSRRAGLMAAAILAFSGWQIAFAWEARMYTLGTLLAILSTWMLLRAIRAPGPLIWLGYGVVAAAFAYVHYFSFFTLVAHALFVLGILVIRTRGRIGEMLQSPIFWFASAAAVLAVALYAPWVPVFLQQNSQVQEAYWIPPIGGWSIPDTFYRMLAPTSGIPIHAGSAVVLAAIPIMAAAMLWLLLAAAPRHRDGNSIVLLTGIIPFLLAIGLSFVGQSLYQDRFLVFANLFLIAGVAMLSDYIPGRWRTGTVSVLLVFCISTSILYWRELAIVQKPGAHAAATEVAAKDEPVVVTSPFVFFAIDHYLQEEFSEPGKAKLYSETGQLAHFAGGPILKATDIIGPALFTGQFGDTVWLVDTTGFGGTRLAVPAQWTVVEEKLFPEVFGYQGEVIVRQVNRNP